MTTPKDLVKLVTTIKRQNLTSGELVYLLNKIRKLIKEEVQICFQCEKFATMFYENCDAYKDYQETLCAKCATYCKLCDAYYGDSGSYKHEHTESEDEE